MNRVLARWTLALALAALVALTPGAAAGPESIVYYQVKKAEGTAVDRYEQAKAAALGAADEAQRLAGDPPDPMALVPSVPEVPSPELPALPGAPDPLTLLPDPGDPALPPLPEVPGAPALPTLPAAPDPLGIVGPAVDAAKAQAEAAVAALPTPAQLQGMVQQQVGDPAKTAHEQVTWAKAVVSQTERTALGVYYAVHRIVF